MKLANIYSAASHYCDNIEQVTKASSVREQMKALSRAEVWLLDELVPDTRGLRKRIERAVDLVITPPRGSKRKAKRSGRL